MYRPFHWYYNFADGREKNIDKLTAVLKETKHQIAE